MGGGDVQLGEAASGHAAFPARSTGSERELKQRSCCTQRRHYWPVNSLANFAIISQ